MYGRQIVIRPRILPAVSSVSKDFLNYIKKSGTLNTLITSQKQNVVQNFMLATVTWGIIFGIYLRKSVGMPVIQ